MAQPRAMVDIVAAKPGADELLEQVRLLVRALGAGEAGQRPAAPCLRSRGRLTVANASVALGGAIERLFPGGLPEVSIRVGRVDIGVVLRHPFFPNQWLSQPVGVRDIIEAEAALDAEPVVVGGAVMAVDRDNMVVADLVGQLTADAAIR